RQLDGAGAGVPVPGAVAVAGVGAFRAAGAVVGAAELVGVGGHDRVGEGLDHVAEQVGTRRGELVVQPAGGVDTVRCGHRVVSFVDLAISKDHAVAVLYGEATPLTSG